jgi:adenylate kinase family enzyme
MAAPSRIVIVGGPGTGKTTLAAGLAKRTGLPVTHLDDIAREGGGRGPERPPELRAADVQRVALAREWIAEGVHFRWIGPLLDRADVVVWLDHVGARRSGGRITRRFLSQALAEARRRRGRERFLRVRDYTRKLREVVVSVPEARTFPHDELARVLQPYEAKVIRCTTDEEVAALPARLGS